MSGYAHFLALGADNEIGGFDWPAFLAGLIPNDAIIFGIEMILTPEEIFNYVTREDIGDAVKGVFIGADKEPNAVKLFRNYERKFGKSIPHKVFRSYDDSLARPEIIKDYAYVRDIEALIGDSIDTVLLGGWELVSSQNLPKKVDDYIVAETPNGDGRVFISVCGIALPR